MFQNLQRSYLANRVTIVIAVALALHLTATSVSPQDRDRIAAERWPEPNAEDLVDTEQKVRDVFGGAVAKAKTREEKRMLAKRIMQAGSESNDDPREKFVLYRTARNIAASAGDIQLAWQVVALTEASFEIDTISVKDNALSSVLKLYSTAKERQPLIFPTATLSYEAEHEGRYDIAQRTNEVAMKTARGNGDAELTREFVNREKRLSSLIAAQRDAEDAIAILQKGGDAPHASKVAGLYLGLVRGDWSRGLPLLAKADDAELRNLAELETANLDTTDARLKMADAWFATAGELSEPLKSCASARARSLYQAAMPSLSGLLRAKVEKRYAELRPPAGITPSDMEQLRRGLAELKSPPSNSVRFDGHYYQAFLANKTTWPNAQAACEALGGHLVTIQSKAENEFVAKLALGNAVWIGLRDNGQPGKWKWVDGTEVIFTNWASGKPDNIGGRGESFGLIKTPSWDDATEDETLPIGYICEWDGPLVITKVKRD